MYKLARDLYGNMHRNANTYYHTTIKNTLTSLSLRLLFSKSQNILIWLSALLVHFIQCSVMAHTLATHASIPIYHFNHLYTPGGFQMGECEHYAASRGISICDCIKLYNNCLIQLCNQFIVCTYNR